MQNAAVIYSDISVIFQPLHYAIQSHFNVKYFCHISAFRRYEYITLNFYDEYRIIYYNMWCEARQKPVVPKTSIRCPACRCACMNCGVPPHFHSARAHSGICPTVSFQRYGFKGMATTTQPFVARRRALM